MGRLLAAVTVLLALLLAGCQPVADQAHPPRNSDPSALLSKLNALMADDCYTGDPRAVYAGCGKYFTELVGTAGAIDDVMPGKPAKLQHAAQQIHAGMSGYARQNCSPADQQPRPQLTEPCSAALRTVNTGLQQIYDGLYPGDTP